MGKAKGKPRKPCLHTNRAKQKKCQDAWTCGELCESYFTDPLFVSACYSKCKANPNPNLQKCDAIADIGYDSFFTRTGTIPPCDNFDLSDTAQGQAFEIEASAAASYNELLSQQQKASTGIQKKAIFVLIALILITVIYLFINKK